MKLDFYIKKKNNNLNTMLYKTKPIVIITNVLNISADVTIANVTLHSFK